MSGSVEFTTTKNASDLLNISASSLRVYAQHMESLGYSFKKIDNARQFSKHDLQLINEAMERYKLTGGTIKDALHYVIVKEDYGEEEAEALQPVTDEQQSHEAALFDVGQFKNELSKDINSNINQTLNNHLDKVIEAVNTSKNGDIDTEHLQKEIERLHALNEQLERDRDRYKSLYENNKVDTSNLRNEINKLKTMSIWEFRKWKK